MADNVLSRKHLQTVIPRLAELGAPYSVFYETTANLTREQLSALADAGVRAVQPGLEGLHRAALRRLGKGNNPAMNLQVLKWARELGIRVVWNYLRGFPGERDEWHAEIARWLPAVAHLQPPQGLSSVRFDRFSPYHREAEKHGLDLEPKRHYRAVYPVSTDLLSELAAVFEDSGMAERHVISSFGPGYAALRTAILDWQRAWAPLDPEEMDGQATLPSLDLRVFARDRVQVEDARRPGPVVRRTFEGLSARILLALDRARKLDSLAREVSEPGGRLQNALADLIDLQLVLEVDGRFLSLPTRGPCQPYLRREALL
jgi:magnesium-protoporphyrin IX monomethyl ester (oxidative) cyclase